MDYECKIANHSIVSGVHVRLKKMHKDLASHPLMKRVFENVKPTFDRSAERLKKAALKGKIRAESEEAITESQSYQFDVFKRANAVLDCVYQLEDIRKFIKRFPSPRTYEKEGISQYRWIEYHYSFFVVTLVSMRDTSLILVNAVFRLGKTSVLSAVSTRPTSSKTGAFLIFCYLNDAMRSHTDSRSLFR